MTRTEGENSYKSILKRISAFGGIQLFNIFVNLLRGKFVAILLGTSGMGISSLYLTASTTLQQLGGLGINLSLVKEVAASKGNPEEGNAVMAAARTLIIITSLLGALLCISLSPLLSRWTFGTTDYTPGFILLGLAVALGIASTGCQAVLQGIGEIKRLSKASVVGSLTGLFVGVPLYYFFGTKGIVPAMAVLALATFLFFYFSLRKSTRGRTTVQFSWGAHAPIVKRLVTLGFIFMIGSLVGSATNYAINALVRYMGDLADVGLFQAANSLTNQYIGIVFSALALDYFPRLAAVGAENSRLREVVNRQAEIVVLIAAPLILGLICLTPLAIRLLLSEEFMPVVPLIRWLAFGTFLQSITFPLCYVFLAKDNKKAYVWIEVIAGNVLWILCSVAGYAVWGLIGLGVSLVFRTIIEIGINYGVCRHCYSFSYTKKNLAIILGCTLVTLAGFLVSFVDNLLCKGVMWTLTLATAAAAAWHVRRLLQSEKTTR